MSNQTTLDLTDIEPTDTGDTATQVDSTEPAELVAAKELMAATLDAAKAAHPKYRFKDITTTVIGIDPGYAKEWRLIAGTLAAVEHVFAVGLPRGVGGGPVAHPGDIDADRTQEIESMDEAAAKVVAAVENLLGHVRQDTEHSVGDDFELSSVEASDAEAMLVQAGLLARNVQRITQGAVARCARLNATTPPPKIATPGDSEGGGRA